MAEKQLILVVEGTAAMGPYWKTIVSDYVEKIVRSFCGNELSGQKSSGSNCELLLVMFNSVGNYRSCLVQRSAWTRDVDYFLQWLLAVPFSGGGFSEVAIAEGLSEALMMFPVGPTGGQNQPNMEGKKHCLLVAASNPDPLPTPVFRPKTPNSENDKSEGQSDCRLSDAEAVAKSFAQCSISLSVICPKQLPKLRAIYNAAKRVPRGADPPVYNSKNPHFLVLISENFMEARAAVSHPGIYNATSDQSPVKVDVVPAPVTSVGGQTVSSIPSANGSMISGSMQSRQPDSAGNGPAIVKIEPITVTSATIYGPTFPPVPTIPRPTSQGVPSLATSSPPLSVVSQDLITGNASVQDVKPVVSRGISQPLRPEGPANSNILNNLSHKEVTSAALTEGNSIVLPSVGQNPMAMHVSNVISNGVQAYVPASQAGYNTGQSGIASITASNTLTGTVPGVQIPATSSASVFSAVSGVCMNQNTMNGLSSNSSGTGIMIPTPGIPQQVSSLQSVGTTNPGGPLSHQSSSAPQTVQSEYVKAWEGNLSGQRQGQHVFITRLEGYRSSSSSETLAANWPATMKIVSLISEDHMNHKQYAGKAEFLVFRAMNHHSFLGQLQEKKLWAVIQLPSQTLLLSVSDKAYRLIGMLFPGDMVVFKLQIPSHHHQQQQQMQQQHPQMQQQQISQLQHQQQQQQPQVSQLQQQQQQHPRTVKDQ